MAIFQKIQGVAFGQVWIRTPYGKLEEAEAWSAGLILGRPELLRADTRLSQHPTESTISVEQFRLLISTGAQPQEESQT